MIATKYPVIDMVKTGQNISKLRKDCGYSAAEIALFMGFSTPTAVYRWERGKALPALDHLFALSRLLNVSMDEILME